MCACIKCWCSGFTGRVGARALLLGSGARVGDEWEPGVWRTSCIMTDARTGAIMGMVAGAKAMALDERASIFRSEGEFAIGVRLLQWIGRANLITLQGFGQRLRALSRKLRISSRGGVPGAATYVCNRRG